ncbi:MAG: hypothetical protein WDO17_25325 [Alphaproteobacteria bacterium]
MRKNVIAVLTLAALVVAALIATSPNVTTVADEVSSFSTETPPIETTKAADVLLGAHWAPRTGVGSN